MICLHKKQKDIKKFQIFKSEKHAIENLSIETVLVVIHNTTFEGLSSFHQGAVSKQMTKLFICSKEGLRIVCGSDSQNL